MAKVEEYERSEAYRCYVSDSLFFLQHLIARQEDDPDYALFGMKFRDIMQATQEEPVDNEAKAEQIKNDLIAKANALANGG